MKARLKLWVEKDGEYVFGEGNRKLLRKIDELGSLSQAAAELNISYRHAWGSIKKIEERTGRRFVASSRGGGERGGTRLTDFGRLFLERFENLDQRTREGLESLFKELFGE